MKQLKVMCKKVDNFTPNVTDNSNATLIEMCKTIDKASTDEEHKTQASYLAPNVAENSNATLLEMCKIINKSSTPEEYDEHKKQSYSSEDNSIIKAIENMESYAVLGCQSRHSQKTMVELVNNDNQKHPVTLANNNNVEAKEIKFYFDSEFNFYNNILSYNNEPFLNCYIEITGLVIGEKQNYYQCEIYVKGNVFTKNISVSEYSNAKWVNGIPGIAFLGSKNKSKDLLFIYLQKLVDKFDLSRQIKQYKKPGWQIVNEKYFYVTPEGVIGDENIKIVSENGQHFRCLVSSPDSFGKYLSFIECTKSNVATILILYFSMSLCNSLYRKADFTPKFTVFLHGPRGNFKTSLALALTQIEYSDSPIYTLKATKAGLESGFRSYRDSVMLIDDLAPTQVSSDRKALLSNLEVIVRAFGDGTGVVRNFDYLDKEKALEIDQYKAEGGAVLTGEFFEGCESSLARCLFLPLDKNKETLKYEINDFEAEAVKLIFKMYLQGEGYTSIINELNRRGFKTKKANSFGKNSLYDILRNERYTGAYIYNKALPVNSEKKFNRHASKNAEDIIKVEGGIPQIISKEDFVKVQELMNKRRRKTATYKAKEDYLLSGKIICGECGSTYAGNARRSKNSTYISYTCTKKNGREKCRNRGTQRDLIESIILNKLSEKVFDVKILPEIISRYNDFALSKNKEFIAMKKQLEQRLAEIEKGIANIVNLVVTTGSAALAEKLKELELEKVTLEISLKEAERKLSEMSVDEAQLRQAFSKAKSLLKSGTLKNRKAIVQQYVKQVVMYPDKVEIEFNVIGDSYTIKETYPR